MINFFSLPFFVVRLLVSASTPSVLTASTLNVTPAFKFTVLTSPAYSDVCKRKKVCELNTNLIKIEQVDYHRRVHW